LLGRQVNVPVALDVGMETRSLHDEHEGMLDGKQNCSSLETETVSDSSAGPVPVSALHPIIPTIAAIDSTPLAIPDPFMTASFG